MRNSEVKKMKKSEITREYLRRLADCETGKNVDEVIDSMIHDRALSVSVFSGLSRISAALGYDFAFEEVQDEE